MIALLTEVEARVDELEGLLLYALANLPRTSPACKRLATALGIDDAAVLDGSAQ